MRALLIVILLSLSFGLQAEIYRWVDENGQVHYSDRKKQADAEDITAKTKVQNIDTSQEEQRKVQQILRPENEADRDYRRRQQAQQQSQPDPEHQQRCRELRELRDILKGRVQFIDDHGKEVRYTERERATDLQEAEQLLAQHCSGYH